MEGVCTYWSKQWNGREDEKFIIIVSFARYISRESTGE